MGQTTHELIVDVLTPVAVDTAYSYRVPAGMVVAPGDFVAVPLGARETVGVVWARREGPGGSNLKSVTEKLDLAALSEPFRAFIDWVGRWTLAPRGMVLRMAVRAPDAVAPETPKVGVRLTGAAPTRLTPARMRVLEAAAGGLTLPKAALARLAACSSGVLDGLVDDGVLEAVALPRDPITARPDPDFAPSLLEAEQRAAVDALQEKVRARAFSVALLDGVTGSGKTEVYFEAVAEALRAGEQALVLMPEIALTSEFLARFEKRFGVRPAEWHSAIGPARRSRLWKAVASGEAAVVAGARSALFLPFQRLGLIVVDEEHEAAYKQDDGVSYNARDMAVVRGRLEARPVVLASATPSLETRVNVDRGRYDRLRLGARWGGRTLPSMAAIDLRVSAPDRGAWISPRLAESLGETLARGEQALLFLNRRGYAPLTLCRSCGHRFQCPNCTAWLVEHRFRRALVCHHCGHIERRPDQCPACDEPDSLTACGPGVERLADEVAALFPEARRLTLSSDFPGGTERLRRELEAVAQGEADIVIGTQLVAKGHNFPGMTLVGAIDADLGLANGDPRAAERTFQLLQQVAGRAGRGGKPGRALLQTFQPDHPVMRALLSGDSDRFYREEIEARQRAGLPPFGRLAAVVISAPDRAAAEAHARALARTAIELRGGARWSVAPLGGLPGPSDVALLGPAEAPIAVVRGRHRFRLLARAPLSADLQSFLRSLLSAAPSPRGGVRVAVDVDPQSFL